MSLAICRMSASRFCASVSNLMRLNSSLGLVCECFQWLFLLMRMRDRSEVAASAPNVLAQSESARIEHPKRYPMDGMARSFPKCVGKYWDRRCELDDVYAVSTRI